MIQFVTKKAYGVIGSIATFWTIKNETKLRSSLNC